MISQILQHLDSLQVELSSIDPADGFEAADKVAGIASALRRAVIEANGAETALVPDAHDLLLRRVA